MNGPVAHNAPTPPEWNELDFVPWDAFRRMAPAVVGLELRRLEGLLAAPPDDLDAYNALVRARFELKRFVDRLAEASRETAAATCGPHLQAALLALSLAPVLDPETRQTLHYIADRLTYVHDRLRLVY
ncbi:MAG: hypothetical protein KatS3mg043_1245 [Rhodothermaceae bacterium]|nr:MAG: hypothetical protein KatS3mg043_1245 [Rhodothermaceae bacterium]